VNLPGDFEAFERILAETLEHVPGMRLVGYCLNAEPLASAAVAGRGRCGPPLLYHAARRGGQVAGRKNRPVTQEYM
jgi:hypothetical protein